MSDVTHGLCKKCGEIQPIIWTRVVKEEVGGVYARRFEGMDAKCEVCGFEVARLGQLHPVRQIA